MGLRVSKTEHNGAKHGQGAFWGTKLEAKSGSKKIRRQNFKKEIQEQSEPESEERVQGDPRRPGGLPH